MSRRVRFLLLVVVLLAGGAAVLVVSSQSDLEDRRDRVDARWSTLRAPLSTRYDHLSALAEALAAAGASDRTYAEDLAAELGTWRDLVRSGRPQPGAEAASANRLEGLAVRARENVAHSARLSRDPGIAAALAAFDAALVPPAEVGAYNRAVRRYQSTRTETLAQVAADLLGYGTRPVLVVSGGAGGS